jgi:hypothetical protein
VSDDTPQIPKDAPAPSGATRVDAPPPQDGGGGGGPSLPVGGDVAQERPELVVAGAFAGAFLFAKILRRLGGA